MKALKFFISLLIIQSVCVSAEAKLNWKCWSDAVEEAAQSHKVVMVFFYEKGNVASDKMEQSFETRLVVDRVEAGKVIPVRINVHSEEEVFGFEGEELSASELHQKISSHATPDLSACASAATPELQTKATATAELAYPTLAFMDLEKERVIDASSGLKTPERLIRAIEKAEKKHATYITAEKMPKLSPHLLAGRWKCNEGGTYVIWHEHDNVVSWYAQIPNAKQVPIPARGYGYVEGDKMYMSWTHENGSRFGKGQITFKIESEETMHRIESQGCAFESETLEKVPIKP